jgi:hypothetical protein
LFRCFEPISKQLKPTELFQNKPKQHKIIIKIPKYTLYQIVSVGRLYVSVQSKHQNSLFQYRSEQPKQTISKQTKTNRNKRENPKFSEKIPKCDPY